MGTLAGAFFALLISFAVAGFKLDREYQRGLIFRLGRINGVKGPGLYWVLPLIDQKTQVQDLRNCHKQWRGYAAPSAKQLEDKHGNIRTF